MVATFEASYDPRFRCSDCLTNYRGAHDQEKRVARDRETKGCYGSDSLIKRAMETKRINREEALKIIGYPLGGIRFLKCPGNFRSDWAALMFRSWCAWRLGIQPIPGGLGSLPARTYEAFALFDNMESIRQRKEKEKADTGVKTDGIGKPNNNRRFVGGRTGQPQTGKS